MLGIGALVVLLLPFKTLRTVELAGAVEVEAAPVERAPAWVPTGGREPVVVGRDV